MLGGGRCSVLKTEIDSFSTVLANSNWLRLCDPAFAESFLAHCHWRKVAAGTGIQHAGEVGGAITGVADGSVTVTTSLSSPDSPTIHVMHPGDWFGFVPLFVPGARPNSIVARTDVTLAGMTQVEVEAFLAPRPEWWRHVGVLGVLYANTATSIAADMMIRESNRRCAAALLQLGDCRHRDPAGVQVIEAHLSQEELAAIANLSRTSISMILRDLEGSGLIRLGYRSVTIVNPGCLRAMVDNV
jgi:CRP-like cAMP-binding protein